MIRPNTSVNRRLALVMGVVPAKALAQRPGLLVIIGRQYDGSSDGPGLIGHAGAIAGTHGTGLNQSVWD
jgi:hypothetical protein